MIKGEREGGYDDSANSMRTVPGTSPLKILADKVVLGHTDEVISPLT